jgi:hypothetical protein
VAIGANTCAHLSTRAEGRLGSAAVAAKLDRSRRGELQRLLGDLGTVLPRVAHGSPERPAQGWYARLADGSEIFLGDYVAVAAVAINRLLEVTHA